MLVMCGCSISPRPASRRRLLPHAGSCRCYQSAGVLSVLLVLYGLLAGPAAASTRHLQLQFNVVSESDFGPALVGVYESPIEKTNVTVVSAGQSISDTFFGWPAEVVAFGSLQYFNERGLQPDIIGGTAYIKVYKEFKLGRWNVPLRLGLGEGLSYVSRIPFVEVEDFAPESSEKFTNYLEWTMQTSLSYLLGRGEGRLSAGIKDAYIGYSIFHRSTVFGLFAEKGGGVNFMGIGVEFIFD